MINGKMICKEAQNLYTRIIEISSTVSGKVEILWNLKIFVGGEHLNKSSAVCLG